MEVRLDGKVALVTGGSRGIGFAIAKRLIESGASVMISSRREDQLEKAAAELRESSDASRGEIDCHSANVGDPDQAEACIAATVDRFGALDCLVNNAATNPYFGPLMGLDTPRAVKTVEINQLSVLSWTRVAWRLAMETNGGSVLNVASIGAMSAEAGIGWYNVTKAAVVHLTRQLAYELGPRVRVNAIAPGLVRTHFAKALWEKREEAIAAHLPLRRIGEPDDVATAALFLLSDAASWITGSTLVVDGGALSSPSGGV